VSDIVIPVSTYVVNLENLGDGQAIVNIIVGGICYHSGRYTDETGLLSSFDRIQDSDYYQAFSYVIKSDLSLSKYKSNMALTHPAGYKMFGEFHYTKNVADDVTSFIRPTLSGTLTIE